MSGGGGGDKTEKPTQKKLREARKEGRIARSADIPQWATMLAATVVLPRTVNSCVDTFKSLFTDIPEGVRLGRPAGFKRVYVVDSTVFPSIPATTITFTVMANAHRIGTSAEDGQ